MSPRKELVQSSDGNILGEARALCVCGSGCREAAAMGCGLQQEI